MASSSSSSSASSSATHHTTASASVINASTGEAKVVIEYPLEIQSSENVPVISDSPHLPLPFPQPQPTPEHALYAHLYQLPCLDRPIFFRALTLALLLTLITCIFWFFIWCVVQPSTPQLEVSSGELSKVSIFNNTATASCKLSLTLTNPNHHLTAIYNQMEITLLYISSQRVQLSKDCLPPMIQPRKNETVLNTDLGFYDLDLGKDVGLALKEDLHQGTFTLGVKVLALVNFQNGKWKTKDQLMKAFCGGIILVSLPNNYSRILQDPNRHCAVYLF
ncbi:unnamed protein product [Fraxinus pennsylvanica]|uniref:Late embryogenesis abundant protein LEA-2 subgroup domain-containing protein n=1 Tax=Fraxinus pennsylvanica TaxID=56036 RepID=A0AAD2A907_9LAMI|nr:unnamed protein product [Fraxinus pennsylvanica]